MSEIHYGIDVSEFQSGLDLKSKDPEFVIIRYADGSYHDIACGSFIDQCREYGIPYGLYYLIRSSTPGEARIEAYDILKYIRDHNYRPAMGIWADVEDRSIFDGMADAAKEFCSTIQGAGYYAGIYCNWSYYRELYPDCSAYDCWIADWSGPDPNGVPGTMQQYSTSGGVLDLDCSFVPLSTYDLGRTGKTPAKELIEDIREKLKELEELLK